MKTIDHINLEKITFFCICLFPITIIIGQAAISLNYFFVTICFFLLLNTHEFRLLLKDYFFYIAPFFIFLVITQMINFKIYETKDISKSIFYFKNFFLFFVLIYSLKSDRYKIIFYYIIFACCLFVALDNIFQYIMGYDFFSIEKSTTRLTGPFGDKEFVSGSYLVKFSIIFLPLFFLNKKLSNVIFLYFIIIFFFLSILITGERASTLLFIIGSLFFFFFQVKNIKKFFSLCIIFIIFLILMINFNKNTKYKFYHTSYQIGIMKYFDKYIEPIPEQFTDYKDRSFLDSNHGAHYLTAIEIWKKNKFFGIGTKNYIQECGKEYYKKINSLNYKQRCSTHPHNYYLELLSENGFFGLFLFFLIIFKVFKSYYNSKFKKNSFLSSSLSQNIVILWPIISTGSLISNFNGTFIWINLALLVSISHYGFKYNVK
jgi:O-antigen ligase